MCLDIPGTQHGRWFLLPIQICLENTQEKNEWKKISHSVVY